MKPIFCRYTFGMARVLKNTHSNSSMSSFELSVFDVYHRCMILMLIFWEHWCSALNNKWYHIMLAVFTFQEPYIIFLRINGDIYYSGSNTQMITMYDKIVSKKWCHKNSTWSDMSKGLDLRSSCNRSLFVVQRR